MRIIVLLFLFTCLVTVFCFSQRTCSTNDYTGKLLAQHPEQAKSIQLAGNALLPHGNNTLGMVDTLNFETSVITIPVVVHILYSTEEQNISTALIKSQIDVLNKDFRKRNADASNIPAVFKWLASDVKIEFKLAAVDPSGVACTGIVRKKTGIEYFGIDDRIKSSAIGGDDAWDRDKYLNIWVGNLAGGIVGYASVPGGPADKDGVVIRSNAFGITGNVSAPYNKGRTATHEIGHWLGLRHIWGDTYCGDDKVDDTPRQQSSTNGCPSGVVISCDNGPNGNMYMNFMDFTNDECLSMFTRGQAQRMRASFSFEGPREALLFSGKADGIPLEESELGKTDPPVSAGDIVLYPNPVIGQLTIRFEENEEIAGKQLFIYNHLGQTVKQMPVTNRTLQVNTSALKNGLYYITTGTGKTYKFIKVN